VKKLCTIAILACGLLLAVENSFADQPEPVNTVTPVPSDISPVKIDGAKPRNVVKQGVHLKNAFVTTSLCSPSRASILTGLYTFRHRVIDNQRAVPEGTQFFPQYLQKAGYKTGYVGKWHMGGHSDKPKMFLKTVTSRLY